MAAKIKMMCEDRSILPFPLPRLFILFSVLFLSISSKATEFQAGSEITVRKKQQEDFYLAGGEIRVNGDMGQDLLIAGGTIHVNGNVGEDLMISGGQTRVKGDVGDDVRIFGGEIRIDGKIDGDLLVFGGEMSLEESAVVKGILKVYGGKVNLYGNVQGATHITGGEFNHHGRIEGDLRVKSGKAEITGKVNGKSILASRTLEVSNGAAFGDEVRYWRQKGSIDLSSYMESGEATLDPALKHQVMSDAGWSVLFFGFWIAWGIYILSVALILFLLNFFLTRSFKRAGIAMEHWGKSLGFGALYVFGTPIAALILLFTLIGAPIGLVAGTIWGLSMLFTHMLASIVITHWIKLRYNKAWDRMYLFLVSLAIYVAIKAISLIPFIGWLFSILIVLTTYGAILLARRALFTNRPMVRI